MQKKQPAEKNGAGKPAETKEQKLHAQLREKEEAQQETKEKQGQEKGLQETKEKQGLLHQLQELRETLQRVQADFENTCKKTEKEKAEFRQFANAAMVKELLPLLDSMDAAVEKLQKQENVKKEEMLNGLRLLRMQLLRLLQMHGLQEIKCLGEKFNPMLHEALTQGWDESRQEDCVLEELQKGYLLNERVLRHSKVKINRIKEENEGNDVKATEKKEGQKNGEKKG